MSHFLHVIEISNRPSGRFTKSLSDGGLELSLLLLLLVALVLELLLSLPLSVEKKEREVRSARGNEKRGAGEHGACVLDGVRPMADGTAEMKVRSARAERGGEDSPHGACKKKERGVPQ